MFAVVFCHFLDVLRTTGDFGICRAAAVEEFKGADDLLLAIVGIKQSDKSPGSNWRGHFDKLKDLLGNRVYQIGDAKQLAKTFR